METVATIGFGKKSARRSTQSTNASSGGTTKWSLSSCFATVSYQCAVPRQKCSDQDRASGADGHDLALLQRPQQRRLGT